MPSVLFVCTANQFRSPFAAACLIDFIQQVNPLEKWRVESAGTWTKPGLPASPLALQNAHRLGLRGLEVHITRQVNQELLDQFDLILVMETGHLEAIASEFPNVLGRMMLLSEIVDGTPYSILDPADQGSDPDEVASELQMLIQRGGRKILKLAKTLHYARRALDEGDS
jgi:protein-tyrosine phosphatase